MTYQEFNEKMNALLERDPFQAFTVFLVNGKEIEITDPWKVLYRREGAAIWAAHSILGERFDHGDVLRFAVPNSAGSLVPV